MLEKEVEKKVCDYAKSQGWLTYKFVSPSNRGVPDRIFMRQHKMLFIEFKANGKKPTGLQMSVALDIAETGFQVYVVDDVERGKGIIDAYTR